MRYAFGDRVLDTDAHELRGPDGVIDLEPQVFAVLAHLVDQRHRVVPKEDLLDEVWGSRFVSESALTTRIKQVRRAVGDSGREQRVVRTFHGTGYRFVAEIRELDHATDAGEPGAGEPGAREAGAGVGGDGRPAAAGERRAGRMPRTRYAEAPGASIAYQTFGRGRDLVLIAGFGTNVEVQWEHPLVAAFLDRLGSFARVTVLDKRGVGLSDRLHAGHVPPLEVRADDLHVVMDAASIERATVLGSSEGGSLAALFAATHPERVERLILHNTWVVGPDLEVLQQGDPTRLARSWGKGVVYRDLAPSLAASPGGREFLARFERQSASPNAAQHLLEVMARLDITGALGAVSVPTVVLHRRDDPIVPLEHGHRLARGIPNARLIELEGSDHYLFSGDPDETLAAIERAHTGSRVPVPPLDRVLATVLFVDIVGSTGAAQRLGDERWAGLLDDAETCMARVVAEHRGEVVKSTGDGVLATFDAPGRGVQAALGIAAAVVDLGLEIRAGLHTSEVQRRGSDIAGIGVNLASRVADVAPAGRVWVTRTITDLVAGTGLEFDPCGTHALKGIDRPWDLYAVRG